MSATDLHESRKKEIPPLPLSLPKGSAHVCCSGARANCCSSETAQDCSGHHAARHSLNGIGETHETIVLSTTNLQSSEDAAEGAHYVASHADTGDETTGGYESLLSRQRHLDNCEYHFIGSVATLEHPSAKLEAPSVKRHKEKWLSQTASAQQSASPSQLAATQVPGSMRAHWMLNSLPREHEGQAGRAGCAGCGVRSGRAGRAGRTGRAGRKRHWLLTSPH